MPHAIYSRVARPFPVAWPAPMRLSAFTRPCTVVAETPNVLANDLTDALRLFCSISRSADFKFSLDISTQVQIINPFFFITFSTFVKIIDCILIMFFREALRNNARRLLGGRSWTEVSHHPILTSLEHQADQLTCTDMAGFRTGGVVERLPLEREPNPNPNPNPKKSFELPRTVPRSCLLTDHRRAAILSVAQSLIIYIKGRKNVSHKNK